MTRRLTGFLGRSLLLVCLSAAPAMARNCVLPGDILDVPTPGYLRHETPNLVLDFDTVDIPVTPLSVTTSRIRIAMPDSGIPYDSGFKVRHLDGGHHNRKTAPQGGHGHGHGGSGGQGKVVANGKTCADPGDGGGGTTGDGRYGGSDDAGRGGAGTGRGGGGNGRGGTGGNGGTNPDIGGNGTTGGKGGGGTAVDSANGAGGAALKRRGRVPTERATRNDVAAPSGAPEYVILGSNAQTARAESVVIGAGGVVLRSRSLGNLGQRLSVIDLNGALSFNQFKSALARGAVGVTVDRHSVYGAAGDPVTYAGQMVGLNPASPCQLSRSVRVGLIDGPVDASNPALQGVAISTTSVLGATERQGSSDHATGIAALIAASAPANPRLGLAPGAQIYSVVAFAKSGGREVARLENIAMALDWLIQSRVGIVNMSLAGPHNDTLAQIIDIADKKGIILVAASGNGGRGEVSYPASDPRVIGITAIDANKRLYRKANFGAGVDFAAPGVDVLVPSKGGTSYRSGTSYASAVATAVIAQIVGQGVGGHDGVVNALRNTAEDLGTAGRDDQFGWGLIRLNGC